jgi:hypothetical protein
MPERPLGDQSYIDDSRIKRRGSKRLVVSWVGRVSHSLSHSVAQAWLQGTIPLIERKFYRVDHGIDAKWLNSKSSMSGQGGWLCV